MLKWLKQDLAENDAEWTFVFYHVPTFNIGGHGSSWGQEDVLPILEEHEVDFVITGHSHLYERFVPIGPPGKKPIIHVVTGGGGAPLYAPMSSPILAAGVGAAEHHFCVFDVASGRCEMTVKRPDGSILDRLLLVKENGVYQEDIMAAALATREAQEMAHASRQPEAE